MKLESEGKLNYHMQYLLKKSACRLRYQAIPRAPIWYRQKCSLFSAENPQNAWIFFLTDELGEALF